MPTIFEPVETSTVDPRAIRDDRASLGAIVAGVVVMAACAVWLSLLGVGVGVLRLDLSTLPRTPLAWVGVSTLVASFAGGLAAGRLCGAAAGNTARWHGLVAWCATALLWMAATLIILDPMLVANAGLSSAIALWGCGGMVVCALAAWLGGGLGAPAREDY